MLLAVYRHNPREQARLVKAQAVKREGEARDLLEPVGERRGTSQRELAAHCAHGLRVAVGVWAHADGVRLAVLGHELDLKIVREVGLVERNVHGRGHGEAPVLCGELPHKNGVPTHAERIDLPADHLRGVREERVYSHVRILSQDCSQA